MSSRLDAWRRNLKPRSPLKRPNATGLSFLGRWVLAFTVANSSMYPRFRRGERLYCRPSAKLVNGDDVIVKLKGETNYAVVCLVRRTRDAVVCWQYNPGREIVVPRAEIERLLRPLTYNEFAGVARASQIRSRLRRGVPTGEPYYDENPEHYERQRQAVLASYAATGRP
jgi:hypothetical protein